MALGAVPMIRTLLKNWAVSSGSEQNRPERETQDVKGDAREYLTRAGRVPAGGRGLKALDFVSGIRRVKGHPSKQQRLAGDPDTTRRFYRRLALRGQMRLRPAVRLRRAVRLASGIGFARDLKIVDFGTAEKMVAQ